MHLLVSTLSSEYDLLFVLAYLQLQVTVVFSSGVHSDQYFLQFFLSIPDLVMVPSQDVNLQSTWLAFLQGNTLHITYANCENSLLLLYEPSYLLRNV